MEINGLIKQSGLTVDEMAGICGVTRMAVYTWKKGGKINPLRKPKIDKLFGAIEAAIRAGDLPPKVGKKQKDLSAITARKDEIKAVLVKHLRAVTPTA